MRYKVGDKVRVRDWDDMVKEFGICGENITVPGCYFVEFMKKYCNCIVTISELTINGKYLVKEDANNFYWCDEMFEPYDKLDNALDEMMKKINQYDKEIEKMKKETKPIQPKQKTKRERLEEKIAKYQTDSGIESVEIVVMNKVIKIKMDDIFSHWKSEYKMVCDDQDVFSLERAIYLAYAKDECRGKYTPEGIEAYADQITMEKKFVARVKAAMKLYECQVELKKLDKEEAAMIQRKKEKRWKQKERRAERKRNEQIAMQKEAYVQAWKEIEELKNHELEKDIDLIELTEENAEDISVEE